MSPSARGSAPLHLHRAPRNQKRLDTEVPDTEVPGHRSSRAGAPMQQTGDVTLGAAVGFFDVRAPTARARALLVLTVHLDSLLLLRAGCAQRIAIVFPCCADPGRGLDPV